VPITAGEMSCRRHTSTTSRQSAVWRTSIDQWIKSNINSAA